MFEMILNHPLFGLIFVIAIGFLIGRIKLGGVSLDSAGILFAGLAAGYSGLKTPDVFLLWGQALFIFAIGMQSGPGLVAAFRQYGRKMLIITLPVLLSGVGVTWLIAHFAELDWSLAAGLFTGALTSTPGLAAAIEATGSPLASIGYGAAYPVGVLMVILFVRLVPKFLKLDLNKAAIAFKNESSEHYPALDHRNFIVQNPAWVGRSLTEINFTEMTGATISRVRKDEKSIAPAPNTVFELGDLIKAVGSTEALDKVRLLVGPETNRKITFSHSYCAKWILVSNRKNVNRSLAELDLLPENRITVTRIRRSGVDFQPGPADRLRLGDRLRIVCHTDQFDWIVKTLGNALNQLGETDLLPVFLGLGLGLVLGNVSIPIPGLPSFRFGLTGGILISAVLLSRLVRTGPVVWSLSPQASQILRDLGLACFLAVVGTQAGSDLGDVLTVHGISILGLAAIITLIPMVTGMLIGRFIFKMNPLTLLGVLTGAMTSTPGLGAAQGLTKCSAPSVAYATVYPVAMVGVIILARLIGGLM
ncbi:transporter [bacterium]|nr:transporter [bacterium]